MKDIKSLTIEGGNFSDFHAKSDGSFLYSTSTIMTLIISNNIFSSY